MYFVSAEARERAVKAISFAKLLRKDLEVSAEFSFLAGSGAVLERLHLTGHVQARINPGSDLSKYFESDSEIKANFFFHIKRHRELTGSRDYLKFSFCHEKLKKCQM